MTPREPLTAEDVTDEMVRELRASLLHDCTPFEAAEDAELNAVLHACDDALYAIASLKSAARTRIAEILNARRGK
jgi:hypothetical protein